MVYERVTPPWWDLTREEEEEIDRKNRMDNTEHPEIDQECPQCGNDRLQFWTKQLRSADEGAARVASCLEVHLFGSRTRWVSTVGARPGVSEFLGLHRAASGAGGEDARQVGILCGPSFDHPLRRVAEPCLQI